MILFFSAYKILSHGISLEKIIIGKIRVSQLYLKLDNKLVLQIEKLDLQKFLQTPSKKPMDIEKLSKYVRYFTWGIAYFQDLSIKKIILDKENIANVYYDGKKYRLLFPKIEADFDIQEDESKLKLNIQTLKLVKMDLHTKGRIVYVPKKNEIAFDLSTEYKPTGDRIFTQGYTNLKRLHLDLKTNELKNLEITKPFVHSIDNPALKDWLYHKIFFDKAKIESLSFSTILTQKGFLAGVEKTLKGKIKINIAEVSLFNGLDSIKAQEINATLSRQKITLALTKPTYGETNLDGSSIEFSNLFNSPKMVFFIKSSAFNYSTNLLDLLAHYNIKIPVKSIQSPLSADLKLSLQFLPNQQHDVSLGGNLVTYSAMVDMFNIPFFADEIKVGFDITPQYKYVYISANKAYYYNMLYADVDGVLDLKEQTYKARLKVHSAHINTNQEINYLQPYLQEKKINLINQNEEEDEEEERIPKYFKPSELSPVLLKKYILASLKEDEKPYTQEILKIANQENFITDLNINFSDSENIEIVAPEFKVKMLIQNNLSIITFDDFSLFRNYSPLLSYLDIRGGNARVETSDFKTFDILFSIDDLWLPLYDKKTGQNITSLEFSGRIDGDEMQIDTLDKSITFRRKFAQNKIKIKNYDFNVNEFLDSKIPAIQQALHGSGKESEDNNVSMTKEQVDDKLEFLRLKHQYQRQHGIKAQMTNIEVEDMMLYYDKYKVPADEINIRFRDQRILADLTYKNGIANIDFIDGDIYIRASNFSADFVNFVMQKNIIHGGLFTLIGAYKNHTFSGELKVQKTLFKNFVVLQNLINLIDTVPSLIVFKNPNLGAKGYQVSQGSIIFGINKNYLGLEKIHLIGDSMDIDGNGVVQLDSKEMNINLVISTIKNLSNILSKIPIIGYLALGSDGKISTNVSLNGTLDNPKTSVSLAEDVVTAPFRILRRVFDPLNLMVDEIKNEIKDDKYRQEDIEKR